MYSGQESFWAGSLFGPITVALLLKGTGAPSINTHTHCTMYSQRLVVLLLPRRKSRGGVLLVFFLFSAAALLFLNTRHSQNSVVFYRVWLEFVCLIHKAKLFLSNFVRLSTMNFRVRDRE